MIGSIIAYIVFLIIYYIFSAIMFYHLKEFSYVGDACKPMRVAYSVASIIIIISSIILLTIAGGINA